MWHQSSLHVSLVADKLGWVLNEGNLFVLVQIPQDGQVSERNLDHIATLLILLCHSDVLIAGIQDLHAVLGV